MTDFYRGLRRFALPLVAAGAIFASAGYAAAAPAKADARPTDCWPHIKVASTSTETTSEKGQDENFWLAELAKILVHQVPKNFEGAKREKAVGHKMIKAFTGISVKDIKKHGWKGGKNSFIRKPFG